MNEQPRLATADSIKILCVHSEYSGASIIQGTDVTIYGQMQKTEGKGTE